MLGNQLCNSETSARRDRRRERLSAEVVVIILASHRILPGKGREGFLKRLQHGSDQLRFKLPRRLRALAEGRRRQGRKRGRPGQTGRRPVRRGKTGRSRHTRRRNTRNPAHQITSSSASRAPAALIACRIEITSRAVAPMACRRVTKSSTLAPSFRATLRAALSEAVTLVSGT